MCSSSNLPTTTSTNCDFVVSVDGNKIIAMLIEDFTKSLYATIKKRLKDQKMKSEIDVRKAFEAYLLRSYQKYSRIKTILYRREPQFIYDFFEPMDLMYGRSSISSCNIDNILDLGNKLIITGTGGIGKSTLLKHLFINTIKMKKFVPVLVELRVLNSSDMTIDDCIIHCMHSLGFDLDCEYFEYSLEDGCYVFLFDGFDEIEYEKRSIITTQLREYVDKFPNNKYIVSSRPSQEFIGWNDFLEIVSGGLTKAQAVSLINKSIFDKDIKTRFANDLDTHLYDMHKSFASIPLLLNIMLLTYEEHASFPSHITDFYDQAFVVLFNSHDATKDGVFTREIRCKLSYGDFKQVFSHFCFSTFFKSIYTFREAKLLECLEETKRKLNMSCLDVRSYIYDALNAVCMFTQEGLDFIFSHRSFQEYYAAVYTTSLPDDVQMKIFTTQVIDKGIGLEGSNFLSLLYELQPRRVEKNFVIRLLEQWKQEFMDNGRSNMWILKKFVDGIVCRPHKDRTGIETMSRIGFEMADSVIFDLLFTINRWYNENSPDALMIADPATVTQEKLARYIMMVNDRGLLKLSTVEDEEHWKLIFDSSRWLLVRFNNVLSYLEKLKARDCVLELDAVDFIGSL